MRFDDVITAIGEFGPDQKRVYFLICLVSLPAAFQTLIGVFTLSVPEHRCAIPELDNDTYKGQGQWHDDLINRSIPWQSEKKMYSQCELFDKDVTQSDWTNKTRKCHKWVYSRDIFQSTFVTELNLVCDDQIYKTYANMALMGGMLVGSLTLGALSDKFGRKKIFLVSVCGEFLSSLATGFVHWYIPFIILRFATTFCDTGMIMSSYIIGVELVGPSKRKIAGIVAHMFFCFGIFIMAGVSYGIRTWNHLQIVLSCPTIFLLSYVIFLPESPRWMLSTGRVHEASKIIRRVASKNRAAVSEKILSLEDVQLDGGGEKIWHMFTKPNLLFRCIAIFVNWCVASMVYYGLSLNVGSLTGDLFLNFFLFGVVECMAYVICLMFLDTAGRRLLQCLSMLLAGLACVLTLFPVMYGSEEVSWMTVVLSLVGKFGASAAFAVIHIYTAELFPTVMRNSGMGLSSFMARTGGLLSPYIADIGVMIPGDMAKVIHLLIFGGASVVAGLLALGLPETANQMLPDTMQDIKRSSRKHKFKKDTDWTPDTDLIPDTNSKGNVPFLMTTVT